MRRIPLTQGKFALVDDEDFEHLNQWKWHVARNKKIFYAARKQSVSPQLVTTILMHRQVLNYKGKLLIDHKDHDGLNNQKYNLEIGTSSQNAFNRKGLQETNTSGVAGVYWHKRNKKWIARIQINKKQNFIGSFNTIEDAAMAIVNYDPNE